MWKKTLEDLGFQSVLDQIVSCALSEEGSSELRLPRFLTDAGHLRERQMLVGDILRIFGSGSVSVPDRFPPISIRSKRFPDPFRRCPENICTKSSCYIRATIVLRDFLRTRIRG
jgi:hypothetical protein